MVITPVAADLCSHTPLAATGVWKSMRKEELRVFKGGALMVSGAVCFYGQCAGVFRGGVLVVSEAVCQ